MCDVSIVIPSYGRPRELERCIKAVRGLKPEPLETIVVLRLDDSESRRVAQDAALRVRVVDVRAPGHLPPLSAGLVACRGEVLAVLDDDAVPRASWMSRIQRAFSDPHVVGLGGPVADHSRPSPGCLRFTGRATALRMRLLHGRTLYRGFKSLPDPDECQAAGLEEPLPSDLVIGCSMAFRRCVLEHIGIDDGLNRGAAINYEVDIALGAKRFGVVLFDPKLVVDHFPAPRKGAPSRSAEERYRSDYTYNLHYVAGKHFGVAELAFFRAYMELIGQRVSPGLARRLLSGSRRYPLRLFAGDPLAAARSGGLRAGRAAREAGSIGHSTARRGSVS
jgi:glycosyltransferase involved in cell wall biosynthesis